METKQISKHLDRLLLDPNNYRFIDSKDYKPIPENQAGDSRIQQRTLNLIMGKNQESIQDLISSFTTNGFLDIDQIQVKAIEGDKYLVLEGNRRVATLKHLWDEFKKGNDVGCLKESDFKSIRLIEIIGEDPVQHLIGMGLHHISGKKRWNPVNEAQLISDLIEKYGKSEDEICNALGISTWKLRRSLRALGLIKQYKSSDYGDQFLANKYTIFETIISSQPMRNWIDWDNSEYKAKNSVNLERLFEWVSITEEVDQDEDDREIITTREPIITQYRQIKEIAEFIDNPVAVKKMEESRSIMEGYTYSSTIGEKRLKNALENIKGEIQVAFNFSEFLDKEGYESIDNLKFKLDSLIPKNSLAVSTGYRSTNLYFPTIKNHFHHLIIQQYKKLNKLEVKKLSKVNIFVGGNNMGKTSILESFYLASQLNNINAFLELEKFRSRLNHINPQWLANSISQEKPIELKGIFNTTAFEVHIRNQPSESSDFDKTGYITTIITESKVDESSFSSELHLFETKDAERRFSTSMMICPANFTSPYRYNNDLLKKAHSFAVSEKYFDEILSFIQFYLDKNIETIDLIEEANKQSRFMVTSSTLTKAIDITKYGEGLQRVFEIALLMVYSTNGIICIDEIDSAIHKSLLIKFTEFVQRLADKFNVQVFLTTHSKECIDAFVKNDYPDDELMAFAIESDESGKIACNSLSGNQLKALVETMDIDIR